MLLVRLVKGLLLVTALFLFAVAGVFLISLLPGSSLPKDLRFISGLVAFTSVSLGLNLVLVYLLVRFVGENKKIKNELEETQTLNYPHVD